jgi:hypothetical protein
MGWEHRERGGRYYTRTKRVDGRRVREYIGTGPVAELAAQSDARERRLRQALTAAERARIAEAHGLDGLVEELWRAASRHVASELEVAGFQLHHRGEWRRRRGAQANGRGR